MTNQTSNHNLPEGSLVYEHILDLEARLNQIPKLRPIEIFVSRYAIKYESFDRTWKERLLSWPWAPYRKRELRDVPQILTIQSTDKHIIVIHPILFNQMRDQFRRGSLNVYDNQPDTLNGMKIYYNK